MSGQGMDIAEMIRLSLSWYGERGWQSRLGEALGVDRSAVSRWVASGVVPGPVSAAMTCWKQHGGPPNRNNEG